ncbi:prepilin-type N-terminal cleavage/methylation domain-containing protein [Gluconacetobacter tumulisoli]|uniref:Prepilin-type N-terminal cleavage/methylation domain-containing protein n=1 Tax=Gluconacetobacter tumulisoli TaxID=1286189 RepID=A0A7W4K933_9PROT|nr:prepilin-type N-terminal cleavage/methylation domain-containing protein [Gluconacetobacter tumulisoli]MBB2202578.1 prepilin-type N-terminal cleavage/methylation domain-containing protein [Gluconacetobacter tumulisoli]
MTGGGYGHLGQAGRDSGQRGFTLVEILISLVVFSLVLLALERGFQAATMIFERQRGMLASQAELGAVDRFVRHLVEYANGGSTRDGRIFVGRAHGFALRGPLPLALGSETPMADIRLSVDDRHRLVVVWMPYRHVIEPARPTRQDVLLDGVQGIECDYFSDGKWANGWYGNGLPELVRIRILFSDDDRRHWPDIVAAPMTEPMPG